MGTAGLPMVPSSKVAYIQNPGVEWGFRWEGSVVAPWSMSPAKKDPRVQAGCKGLCNMSVTAVPHSSPLSRFFHFSILSLPSAQDNGEATEVAF